ncbi:putative scf e3 ubiquitin ligase complex f-box protein grra [Zalerion maritima]|uniref:Scf e3 ubiquitin ligase complex f-box protein grra n=1 Tax=Zalerion maritima TaxID=339359 RepID=A0AAD5RUD2_9PEZI|nr:putative scf e3 ubiquitin ligase complex f-box protein grra [Zalerion maritima]
MQPQAPSLDIIAAQDAAAAAPVQDTDTSMAPTPENGRENGDSRASSSTNSPAPPEAEESDFFIGNNDSQSSLGVPNIQDMQVTDEENQECTIPVYTVPNEVLIQIFSKLSSAPDLLNVMLTCKRFARNTVDLLWHRPACTNWSKHQKICQTLALPQPYFAYGDFVKRLNLASLAGDINDGSIMPFQGCSRIERLTLTKCKKLTDNGLIPLIQKNPNLLALDISEDADVTEATIYALAQSCRKIQGLNVSSCKEISNPSMVALANNCKYLKRLKLNDCNKMEDATVMAFATNCRNILEIDLQKCVNITNEPVTALLSQGKALRELRLVGCELLEDPAFLNLPPLRTYEHLRILDLTSCALLTDRAVEKIIEVAPRLRNLVLAKCRNITDQSVYAISKLGRNLHYVHLGHCSNITDDAVKKLVSACNRIRYIDLGCCANLTDESVQRLAGLPKLKRIGLVKCLSITDKSVFALSNMGGARRRQFRDSHGNIIEGYDVGYHTSSLERVHLSYCTNLTLKSVIKLLNASPRLTHLSLTGVLPFIREDLSQFCRDAPPDFNDHQRTVFCVFSGQGVMGLRDHLNTDPSYQSLRESVGLSQTQPMRTTMQPGIPPAIPQQNSEIMEDDVVDEDDEDMAIDGGVPVQAAPPPAGGNWPGVIPTPPLAPGPPADLSVPVAPPTPPENGQ